MKCLLERGVILFTADRVYKVDVAFCYEDASVVEVEVKVSASSLEVASDMVNDDSFYLDMLEYGRMIKNVQLEEVIIGKVKKFKYDSI